MKAIFAFIRDQILQFWPPYREQQDDGRGETQSHAPPAATGSEYRTEDLDQARSTCIRPRGQRPL
jgi:hypothetical protein